MNLVVHAIVVVTIGVVTSRTVVVLPVVLLLLVFNCNNVINLKASLQFIFILQLTTNDNNIQQV